LLYFLNNDSEQLEDFFIHLVFEFLHPVYIKVGKGVNLVVIEPDQEVRVRTVVESFLDQRSSLTVLLNQQVEQERSCIRLQCELLLISLPHSWVLGKDLSFHVSHEIVKPGLALLGGEGAKVDPGRLGLQDQLDQFCPILPSLPSQVLGVHDLRIEPILKQILHSRVRPIHMQLI